MRELVSFYRSECVKFKIFLRMDGLRSKRGHTSHKAFLTPQGFKIIKSRRKDFEILMYFKTENACIFTAQYSDKPLERGPFNRLINEFIK